MRASLDDLEFQTVDATQAEELIAAKRLGERMRRLRLKRSMGLVELGQRTSLSASFLSQLETGRVVPTVRNLARLAMVFDKDISYFFRDTAQRNFRVSRAADRIRIRRGKKDGSGFLSESMRSLVADEGMVPCIAEFTLAEEDVAFEPKRFPGVEFTYVMEGVLHFHAGDEIGTLQAGDVLWLDAERKRRFCCAVGQRARAMIVTKRK
jgi:transcriptional regulator with XRE-family HTH domain